MDSALATGDCQPARLLESVNLPSDLRRLPQPQLAQLASEIRELMIDTVCRCGGHLASSLGTVELTIALHYVFDTPRDKLLWDVGHQAYTHKILTGRRALFSTLRQHGGISGFPRTLESEYDTVSAGHASTSISAGLGMAIARDLRKESHEVVSIIGDGSLSGGLAFEGLNNLGSRATKMVVVLNDNKMSISRNVGALSRYLTRLITDRRFHRIKSEVWELLGNFSDVGKGIRSLVHGVDDALKHFVIPGKLFEDMGLHYLGPVDGHNITELVEVLRFVKETLSQPVLIHVVTTKGKGYASAENDSTKYHGVPAVSRPVCIDTPCSRRTGPTYSKVFGETLVDLAQKRNDIVAITAAMPDGTGLTTFRDRFPDRFFDVGIAEPHAVTFASGLALSGMRPVVAMYSTFLQRAYDQIIHDVALDNLPVIFCIDRAGIVGDDGPTHHGVFDVSFLRSVPNLTIMAPSNELELRDMLHTAVNHQGPVVIRYPRGEGTGVSLESAPMDIAVGIPRLVHQGTSCAIVALGDTLQMVEGAREVLTVEGILPTVVDARFIKPLDEAFYTELFARHSHIVTVENNVVAGGFGSKILELSAALCPGRPPSVLQLGYPDTFIPQGDAAQLRAQLKLDAPGIAQRVKEFIA